MGKFRKYYFLIATSLLLALYTNCSGDYGKMSTVSSTSSSSFKKSPSTVPLVVSPVNSNGGGFSGKVTMDFFDDQISCQSGSNWIQQLDVDFSDRSAFLQEQKCSQSNNGSVLFNDIFFTNYSPWFAFYDNKVFANRNLHTNLSGRIKYPLFCYDTYNKVDFAVQYYRPDPVNGVRQSVQIFGYVFNGDPAGQAPNRTQGHIGDPNNEHRTFRAHDGSFVVDVHSPPGNPTLGTGRLVYSDGTAYDLECRFYVPESTD